MWLVRESYWTQLIKICFQSFLDEEQLFICDLKKSHSLSDNCMKSHIDLNVRLYRLFDLKNELCINIKGHNSLILISRSEFQRLENIFEIILLMCYIKSTSWLINLLVNPRVFKNNENVSHKWAKLQV